MPAFSAVSLPPLFKLSQIVPASLFSLTVPNFLICLLSFRDRSQFRHVNSVVIVMIAGIVLMPDIPPVRNGRISGEERL